MSIASSEGNLLAVNQTRSSKGLNELKEIVFDHYPKASVEWALIESLSFALKAHGVQRRQSGRCSLSTPGGSPDPGGYGVGCNYDCCRIAP